jgi:hypothetical protein
MNTISNDLVNGKEDKQSDIGDVDTRPRRHPLTMENSPEETIRLMRALPERAAKLREKIRAIREANAR